MLDLTHRLFRGRQKSTANRSARPALIPAISKEPVHNTSSQTQSLFLHKLPLDIRVIIYSYIFPKDVDTVHLEWRYPRILPLGLRKSRGIVDGLGKWHHSRCGIRIWLDSDRSTKPKCGFCLPTWRETPRIPLDVALLFVCRQIYSEVVNIFYCSLTLHIYSGPTLQKLITSVPKEYLASIRNLWFDWCLGSNDLPHTSSSALQAYTKTWDTLCSFSGLRVLSITIESRLDHPPLLESSQQIENAWLRPLESFGGLKKFNVTVGQEFRGVFERLKAGNAKVLEAPRTINQSTGKPYRSCRSCGVTHGSVSNNQQWVAAGRGDVAF